MFRNYTSRNSSYNPTIIEAARAAWAVPGMFSSIHIGANVVEEELVSATNGFNNPTRETLREAQSVFGKDRMVSSILGIGSGKRATIPAFSVAAAMRVAQEAKITAENLQRMFGTLGVYFRFSVDVTNSFPFSSHLPNPHLTLTSFLPILPLSYPYPTPILTLSSLIPHAGNPHVLLAVTSCTLS